MFNNCPLEVAGMFMLWPAELVFPSMLERWFWFQPTLKSGLTVLALATKTRVQFWSAVLWWFWRAGVQFWVRKVMPTSFTQTIEHPFQSTMGSYLVIGLVAALLPAQLLALELQLVSLSHIDLYWCLDWDLSATFCIRAANPSDIGLEAVHPLCFLCKHIYILLIQSISLFSFHLLWR